MIKTISIVLFCLSLAIASAGAIDPGELFEKGIADYSTGKAEDAVSSFRALHEANPADDIALYLLSAAYAKAGHNEESLKQLKALADSGSCLLPRNESFGSLSGTKEYQAIVKSIAASGKHPQSSKTALTVNEPDFFPEGIAYDDQAQTLYMGSIFKRKIDRIDIKTGKFETVVPSEQDGLMAVLGLKVDSTRQQLWAVSVGDPTMKGYSEKEHAGKNAIHRYDLRTGKLIAAYPLSGEGHYLNDLVVDKSGRVYVTDSGVPQIFTIDPDGKALEVFIPPGKFAAMNGITISDDGSTLFVSDTLKGIYRISVTDRQVTRLNTSRGIETLGNDGLYFYKNSLIGVFNMIGSGRIMRFYLDPAQREVVRTEVLECGNPPLEDPTTAAIAADQLYVIANSQLRKHNADNSPWPLEKLDPIRIQLLKLPL